MEYEHEPTLHDLIKLLRRGLLIAFLAAVATGGLVYFVNRVAEPVFEAQSTVVSSAQDPNQRDFGTTLVTAPPLATNSYIVAINSRPVLAAALEAIDGRAPTVAEVDAFDDALTIRTEGTAASSLIRLLVRDAEPARARDLANALAGAAVQWDEQRATRSLESIIESLQAQIASIDTELAATVDAPNEGLARTRADLALQLSSARALRSGAVGRLELLEAADLPRTPVSPRPTRNAILAALLAIFAAYGLVLLQNALDTRVRSLDDLARTTGLPLLAEFPKVDGGRRKLPKEAASYLRTAVSFATTDSDPKVLLVTSTGSAHGKSSVSMAMAESFARQHYRVLLVDADLRRPVLGSEYGLDPIHTPTVQTALDEPGRARPIKVALGRELTLDVLPGFTAVPNPTELLANNVRELLHHVAPEYDVIVIDCAPVLPVADALTVAPHTSGVVFVVSVPDADRKEVLAAIELLRRVGVRILGTVATNLPKERRGLGGRGYGYGYGYGTDATEEPVARERTSSRRPSAGRGQAPTDEGGRAVRRVAPTGTAPEPVAVPAPKRAARD